MTDKPTFSPPDNLNIHRCHFHLDDSPTDDFTPRTGSPDDLTTAEIPSKYTAEEWREIRKRARKGLHYLLGGEAGD